MTLPAKTPNQSEGDFLVFEPFVFTQFPVLICLFGFSGCGKTLSAIKIAQGLGGKTMFLDTETGRGRVYAEEAKGFGYAELTPPFTPERYIAAIKQVQAAGYNNLLIDSGSHEWDGLGGMLEIAENNVTASGKKMTGLGKWSVKSRHKNFMNTMMAGRMNIIICLRAKDKFLERIVDGRKEIIMEGFVPLQERNFKYDMMIQLPMPEDGQGRYLMDRVQGFKCPAQLLGTFEEGKQITTEVGIKIAEWIKTGQPVDEVVRQLKNEAMLHAEKGIEAFREYWKTLPREKQIAITPYKANFESAARIADQDNAVEENDGDEVPPKNINSTGTDLSSILPTHVGMVDKSQLKDELTIMIETTTTTRQIRDEQHADWWAVVDQLEGEIRGRKSLADLADTLDDHAKQIASFTMAPQVVRDHMQRVIDEVQKGFVAKAA